MVLNDYLDTFKRKWKKITWISIISTLSIIIMNIIDTESDFKTNVSPYMDFIMVFVILLRVLIVVVAIYQLSVRYPQ